MIESRTQSGRSVVDVVVTLSVDGVVTIGHDHGHDHGHDLLRLSRDHAALLPGAFP
jgi:hypothetical protein